MATRLSDIRRLLLSDLLRGPPSAPQTPIEGLNQGLRAAQSGMLARELQAREQQQQEEAAAAQAEMARIFSGQAGIPQGSGVTTFGTEPPSDIRDILPAMLASERPEVQAQGVEIAQALMMQQPETAEPFTLAPGATRFGPGGEIIAANPAAQQPERLIEVSDPSSPTGIRLVPLSQAAGMSAPAPAPTAVATATNVGESERQKLAARADAEVAQQIRENARVAARTRPQIERLSASLDKAAQGPLRQVLPTLGRIIPGLDTTNEQIAQTQINDYVLGVLERFPGAISEGERRFAQLTVQNLGNTKEANRAITNAALNTAFLTQQEAKQFREWRKAGRPEREFSFNFDEVVVPDHPEGGDVTWSDIQQVAHQNNVTIEEVLKRLRRR